jgi:hypothetical protein
MYAKVARVFMGRPFVTRACSQRQNTDPDYPAKVSSFARGMLILMQLLVNREI